MLGSDEDCFDDMKTDSSAKIKIRIYRSEGCDAFKIIDFTSDAQNWLED
jgi:hypothetical protein